MPQRLVRRLNCHATLTSAAAEDLVGLIPARLRRVKAREELAQEGVDRGILVVVEGWACRFRLLPDGRRSILAPLLPGDPSEVPPRNREIAVPALGALTEVIAHEYREQDLLDLAARHPSLALALERVAAADAAMLRERVVSLGQRTACERIAHFLCEIRHRLDAIGLCQGMGCPFPMTQTDMADTLGLTTVHVNRTLQALRSAGLVELRGRRLTLPRLPELGKMAFFDPGYLGPVRPGSPDPGNGLDPSPGEPGPELRP